MTTANNTASYYLADQCDDATACHPPNSLSFVEASMADAKKYRRTWASLALRDFALIKNFSLQIFDCHSEHSATGVRCYQQVVILACMKLRARILVEVTSTLQARVEAGKVARKPGSLREVSKAGNQATPLGELFVPTGVRGMLQCALLFIHDGENESCLRAVHLVGIPLQLS